MKTQEITFAELRARLRTTEEPYYFADAGALDDYTLHLECVSEDPTIHGLTIHIHPGMTPPRITAPCRFPDYDADEALKEGWAMFDVDGRWQLQRDDEMARFASDAEAILYVASCATAGSKLHLEAINMIGQRSED